MKVAAEALIRRLESAGDPKRSVGEKKYLKSALIHLGVPVGEIRRAANKALDGCGELSEAQVLEFARALWASGIHEARVAAAEALKARAQVLTPEAFPVIELFLKESRTWALVDNISTGVLSALAERLEETGEVLDRFAEDGDFWLRRASVLALLVPLRRGAGDFARFSRYAEGMLKDKEFFIRKALGWVLRDTGRKRPELVREWLASYGGRASGLTRREAVKYLG